MFKKLKTIKLLFPKRSVTANLTLEYILNVKYNL